MTDDGSRIRLSVVIRLREGKRVLDDLEMGFVVAADDNLDDIESAEDIGIIEHAQPGERAF